MIARVRAWVRRSWSLVVDPAGVVEADVLTASFMASAVRAGLVACINHPKTKAVATVEVDGRVLAVCVDCLDLGDTQTERGWAA